MTRPFRPAAMIAAELQEAEAMAAATGQVPRDDAFVTAMLKENDVEISQLRDELSAAVAGDLQVSVEGRPVRDHRIAASYFARIATDLQSAYRAVAEMLEAEHPPTREQTALSISGTSRGSFRIIFTAPVQQLELLGPTPTERSLSSLLDVLSAGTTDESNAVLAAWAASASEAAVRSMIRLSATLASSKGTIQFRWVPASGSADRVVSVSAQRARTIAAQLAGAGGREIIEVQGHLGMAQDDPPRIRVRTATDDHVADVRDEELLDLVRSLLFSEVVAEIVVDMSTSATTGAPSTRSELIDLRSAADDLNA